MISNLKMSSLLLELCRCLAKGAARGPKRLARAVTGRDASVMAQSGVCSGLSSRRVRSAQRHTQRTAQPPTTCSSAASSRAAPQKEPGAAAQRGAPRRQPRTGREAAAMLRAGRGRAGGCPRRCLRAVLQPHEMPRDPYAAIDAPVTSFSHPRRSQRRLPALCLAFQPAPSRRTPFCRLFRRRSRA